MTPNSSEMGVPLTAICDLLTFMYWFVSMFLDMAGCLLCDNRTAVCGHSLFTDEAAILFISMVPHPYATLCWSQCVRCGTGVTLDSVEWWI